jgi:hypothetical protein
MPRSSADKLTAESDATVEPDTTDKPDTTVDPDKATESDPTDTAAISETALIVLDEGSDESGRPAGLPASDPLGLENRTIDVSLRRRKPGNRKHRQRLLRIWLRRELARKHPDLNDIEVEKLVERVYREQTANKPELASKFAEVRPTCQKAALNEVNEMAEVAAVFRLPHLLWLRQRFERWTAGPKGALRALPAAVALHMGVANGRPQIKHWQEEFMQATPVLNWQHLYPGPGPGAKSFYKSVEQVLERDDPAVCQRINAEHWREIAGELVPDGKGSHVFANHARAGMDLMVDAMLIEAWLPQRGYGSEVEWLELVGDGRQRCRFITYTHDGKITRRVFGYKLLVISCLATGGLPLAWALIPATGDERSATLALLPELFDNIPELAELPEIHLIGDALFDASAQFAAELIWKWGIHPVFQPHGTTGAQHEWHKTAGVPVCGSGIDMKLDEAERFPTPHQRRTRKEWRKPDGTWPRPGEWVRRNGGEKVDDAARIRWKCDPGLCGLCKGEQANATTYPRENPRLYTYLPRRGDHARAHLRSALGGMRNVCESGFAELQRMGLAGEGQERPRWAEDDEMDWLLSLGLMSRTARRLVHVNGLYEETLEEAQNTDLLTQPTVEHPSPGPPDRTPEEAAAWIAEWAARAQAPPGYEPQ